MFLSNKMKNKIGLIQILIIELVVSMIIGNLIAYLTKGSYCTNSKYIDSLLYLDLAELDHTQLLLFVLQSRIKDYLLIWLFSITILAVPYNTFYILYKGFTAGFVIGSLTVLHGWKGILLAVGLGMPHDLVYLVVMLQTIMLSYKMHENCNNGIYSKRSKIFVKHVPTFFVLLSVTIIGCFMESFLNPILFEWLKTGLKLI